MKKRMLKVLCVFLVLFSLATLVACSDKTGDDVEACTITFDSGGGTNVASQTVKKGEKATAPENPTKVGYVFDGWYVGEEKWSFAGCVVTENMTLTAKWLEGVTVMFVDENGKELFPSQTVLPGSKVNDPGVPVGYSSERFSGWFLEDALWDFDSSVSNGITLKALSSDKRYDWPAGTEIIMQISVNSAGDEISSGGKSYYSGQDMQGNQSVLHSVRKRNNKAEDAACVDVKYLYAGESRSYGYRDIATDVFSGSTQAPDIVIGSVNNIVAATLRKCFENLLSTDPEIYPKGNHFSFVKENYDPSVTDYFDKNSGEGYLYSYMESLSLTPKTQLYSVVSNYTFDAIRSLYVIPVNLSLMGMITDISTAPAGDQDGDGDHDIKDFYAFIQNGEYSWDYEALAGYATLCKSNTNLANPNADIKDEIVGFAYCVDSLHSSALLYSTELDILTWDAGWERYGYSFRPPVALVDATKAFSTLLANNLDSICAVTREECLSSGLTGASETAFAGIRNKFAQNGVLFGGIVCIGHLENEAYQNMRNEGTGLGFVPVPIYQDHAIAGDKYLASMHITARVAAISRMSTEKSQCSAFLDYQSRNSADILESYCDNFLDNSSGELAGDYNSQMVNYMRNHARSGFDMILDEVLAYKIDPFHDYLPDPKAYQERWRYIFESNNFSISNMDTMYYAYYETKQADLDDIYAIWRSLGTLK